jgi:hypothetical protein
LKEQVAPEVHESWMVSVKEAGAERVMVKGVVVIPM